MTDKPVWLLDVDGVINTNRPGWSAAPRQGMAYADGTGWKMRWASALTTRIQAIHQAGLAEIRWCTTWCERTAQLGRMFGIGPFDDAFGTRPDHKTYGDLKAEAALAVLADGRRLIWADDAEVPAARDLFPQIASAEADGRALLIAPDERRGLQPADLDAVEAFAAAITAR